MHHLRVILLTIALTAGLTLRANDVQTHPAETAPLAWRTDYDGALKQSAKDGKPVLLDFTGSDWCIWCHRLSAEVFDQPAFRDYAEQSLILVEVDFPQRKKLPKALIKQNFSLQSEFHIEGYPTIVLVDAHGKELGRLGYMEGGAKTFVRSLQRLLKNTS